MFLENQHDFLTNTAQLKETVNPRIFKDIKTVCSYDIFLRQQWTLSLPTYVKLMRKLQVMIFHVLDCSYSRTILNWRGISGVP